MNEIKKYFIIPSECVLNVLFSYRRNIDVARKVPFQRMKTWRPPDAADGLLALSTMKRSDS